MDLKNVVKDILRPIFYFAMQPRINKLCKMTDEKLKSYNNRYEGKRCFIIGNGPSLSIDDLEKLKSEFTFGCNRIYIMFDKTNWRPNFYCCQDPTVIRNCKAEINSQNGFVKFIKPTGQKKYDIDDAIYFNVEYSYRNRRETPPFSNNMCKGVYDGFSIVYSQIQMAVYMGFKEIYLIGVDCNYSTDNKSINANSYPDERMYDPNKVGFPPDFEYTFRAYESAKKYCDEHKIKIFNATRGGKLEIFDRINVDDLF